jgi:uncharacterized membrane protein YfcA
MSFVHILLLIAAGFAAGMINAVAGGGAFITFPTLLLLGVPAINANTTSSVAVWPGALTSAYAYRTHMHGLKKRFYLLLIPCLVGGLFGAIYLSHTSNHSFEKIAPWLILFGVTLFIMQGKIHKWLRTRSGMKITMHRKLVWVVIILSILALGLYGGYFGAGFGIIFLGFLGLTELTDIQQMNGLKNLAGMSVNITANAYFIMHGLVYWSYAIPMFVGSLGGGFVGATFATRLPNKVMRAVIIVIGLTVAAVLFVKA